MFERENVEEWEDDEEWEERENDEEWKRKERMMKEEWESEKNENGKWLKNKITKWTSEGKLTMKRMKGWMNNWTWKKNNLKKKRKKRKAIKGTVKYRFEGTA